MSNNSAADAALVRAASTLLGEIANPFSEANIGEDFQNAGPDAPPLTMAEIRTMQGEFYTALQQNDVFKIGQFADAIKGGLAFIKGLVI